MAPAPWDSVPARDTCFVLVTGANSGIGLGICQRLIDEFLATRSLTSHLVVIPTTRSTRKSAETAALLRKHLHRAASRSKQFQARGGTPEGAAARVHVASLQLDLCDFVTVRRAADRLVDGTLALEGHEVEFAIPRLDAVIFNAGIGGWTGVNWLKAAHNLLTAGWVQATTWPTFKAADPGLTVNPLPSTPGYGKGGNDGTTTTTTTTATTTMGQVFCANVFGHYLFAHAILPLLTRPRRQKQDGVDSDDDDDDLPPGRIIWESSLEAAHGHFTPDDFQGVRTRAAYESTKRLTDLLCLTADLPSVRPHVQSYWRPPRPSPSSNLASKTTTRSNADEEVREPRVYLCHPGIVVTTIMPLPLLLFYAYKFAMYVTRWAGSPWHTNTSYTAAASMVWLALAAQEALDARRAQSAKWGSASDFWGNSLVKKTEVDGWGWTGKVEGLDDEAEGEDVVLGDQEGCRAATGLLRKIKGRRAGAELVTEEKRAEFEEMGAHCWREMERLRGEWEERIEGAGLNGHAA